jgi:transcriptional regulator with XRE-family HTH domain
MNTSPAHKELLTSVIGGRVSEARLAAGLTLDELAQSSGVSRRTIVSIEQGDTNPSILVLLKLASILGVSLASLVKDRNLSELSVIRNDHHKASWTGDNGGEAKLVAHSDSPEILELWSWELGPGDNYISEPHVEGTHELIHVTEGQLTLRVGEELQTLLVGDSASFSGEVFHSYSNEGTNLVKFSLSVYQPIQRKSDD